MTATRLQAIAQRSAAAREQATERCELCGGPMGADHRHVLEVGTRELRCTCRACAILFDRRAAAGGRLRLVPDRRLHLDGFVLDDVLWADLRLPVDIAFFVRSAAEGRVQAFYPSPMGPTESLLGLGAWERLEAANPVLETLEPDVEALLVDRARGARRQWLVPIDECYGLVGLIRTRWRGLTGGKEVWEGLQGFFDELDRRSRPAGGREAGWPR